MSSLCLLSRQFCKQSNQKEDDQHIASSMKASSRPASPAAQPRWYLKVVESAVGCMPLLGGTVVLIRIVTTALDGISQRPPRIIVGSKATAQRTRCSTAACATIL